MNTEQKNIRTLLTAVFGESMELPNDLHERVRVLCDTLRGELGIAEENLDVEWARHIWPRVETWLYALAESDVSFGERVLDFTRERSLDMRLGELGDEVEILSTLKKALSRLAEYLEAKMPDVLLVNDHALLDIDTIERIAWWYSEEVKPAGIKIEDVVTHAVSRLPESWAPVQAALKEQFAESLVCGDLPLPGFCFFRKDSAVITLRWTAPEAEEVPRAAKARLVVPLLDTEGEFALEMWERWPEVAADFEAPLVDSEIPGTYLDRENALYELVGEYREHGMGNDLIFHVLGLRLGESLKLATQQGNVEAVKQSARLYVKSREITA